MVTDPFDILCVLGYVDQKQGISGAENIAMQTSECLRVPFLSQTVF
jgi:hypothetical protein